MRLSCAVSHLLNEYRCGTEYSIQSCTWVLLIRPNRIYRFDWTAGSKCSTRRPIQTTHTNLVQLHSVGFAGWPMQYSATPYSTYKVLFFDTDLLTCALAESTKTQHPKQSGGLLDKARFFAPGPPMTLPFLVSRPVQNFECLRTTSKALDGRVLFEIPYFEASDPNNKPYWRTHSLKKAPCRGHVENE